MQIIMIVGFAMEIKVDERGIPIELDDNGISAKHCPVKPCDLCIGDSVVVKGREWIEDPEVKGLLKQFPIYMTSWEWCQDVDTCAATVDWEKLYGRE